MTMDYKLIGIPCGHHGPYTFYKAFKYSKNGKTNILALSDFFFVKLWNDSDLISIGELQLLWKDKNTEQTLASLRLYILPENTPEGRNDLHGEDEVLAISEKVVIRVEDLLTWITDANDWSWGLSAVWNRDCTGKKFSQPPVRPQLLNDCAVIDLDDIDKEKDQLDESHWETSIGVVVLSFPRYCRYRGVLRRLEGVHNKWLRTALVVALGGFTVPCRNTRVLYCKDTFDYPDLEGHELLCNHLAPKLKGRPRRKRKRLSSRTPSPDGSEESESESSVKSSNSSTSSSQTTTDNNNITSININNNKGRISLQLNKNKNGLHVSLSPRRSARAVGVTLQEKEFLSKLHTFMKNRLTPISRVPTIGFKEIDLYAFYNKVKHLGGYDAVTASRLWKYVYEEMGGDQTSTSAATISRRHYERFLLPFERQCGGQSPMAVKVKQITEVAASTTPATTTASTTITTVVSSSDSTESNDGSPSLTITPSVTATLISVPRSQVDARDNGSSMGSSTKPNSLRGVRLKPDKSNGHTTVEVKSGGKENIPVKNVATSSTTSGNGSATSIKQQPLISTQYIDLVSEDSQSPNQAHGNIAALPSLKKQKLDILKEGGLEVTPVATNVSSTITNMNSISVSVTQNNKNNNNNDDDMNCKNNSSKADSSTAISSSNSSNNNNNNAAIKITISNTNTNSRVSNSSNSVKNNSSNSNSSNKNSICNIKIPQPHVRNSQNNSSVSQAKNAVGSEESRPSVIKHAFPDTIGSSSSNSPKTNANNNSKGNKISITVTPDVSSMLTMSGMSSQLSPAMSASPAPVQHRSAQPIPGLWSSKTVYGNPKDDFQQPVKRPVAEEVLDLRTKTDDGKTFNFQQKVKSSKNASSTQNKISNPYGHFGSNLEITLVPANKCSGKVNNSSTAGIPLNPAGMLMQTPPPPPQQHQQKRGRKSQMSLQQSIFNNGNHINHMNNISLRDLNAVSAQQLLNMNMNSKHQMQQKANASSLVVPNVSLTINQRNNSRPPTNQTQPQPQPRIAGHHSDKIMNSSPTVKHQNNVSSSSSNSSSGSGSGGSASGGNRSSSSYIQSQHRSNNAASAYQQMINSLNSFHHNSKMPFIPAAAAMDPIYLSALFNGLLPHGLMSQSSSPRHHNNHFNLTNPSNPTPEQLQSYRELLRRHSLPHTTLPDGFPRLINDGSTSITLVNNRNHNSTPTSK